MTVIFARRATELLLPCISVMQASISPKLKALLVIAGQVQQGGKYVKPESVEEARHFGATDMEIHDTVLIAAAFSMYNRYVDGLGTWQPRDEALYAEMGKNLAAEGYRKASISPSKESAA
jgi:alkylhydroperoxidase/carboxymuconolactone decarboxylase family protein YurZ